MPAFWAHHADRRPFLLGRMRIAAALRPILRGAGFRRGRDRRLGAPSPGNETHLHAFATELVAPAARASGFICEPRRNSPARSCWPRASRIVEFARSFRNRERGALHHPEFTLVEWYRANEPYEALMEDCAAILALAAEAAGTRRFAFRDRAIDPFAAPERLSVAEAFALRRHRSPGDVAAGAAGAFGRGGAVPPVFAPQPMTPGATCSAACWSNGSSLTSGSSGRRSSTNIRRCSRRSPGRKPPIRGWPSASSSMPAASSLPTASASSPTPPSSAAARGADGGERAHLRRAPSDR